VKTLLLRGAISLSILTLTFAAAVRIYPGAKLDAELMKKQGAMSRDVYRTPDSFEKVYNFYKGFAKEDMEKKKTVESIGANKAPDGQDIKRAYFSFDGMIIGLIHPAVHRDKTVDNATFITFVPDK